MVRISTQSSTHPGEHQIAFASLDTLPMQFYPPTVTGREVASEQCEEVGDRNADAGGLFP